MVFIYKAVSFSLKVFLFGLKITDCKRLNIEYIHPRFLLLVERDTFQWMVWVGGCLGCHFDG